MKTFRLFHMRRKRMKNVEVLERWRAAVEPGVESGASNMGGLREQWETQVALTAVMVLVPWLHRCVFASGADVEQRRARLRNNVQSLLRCAVLSFAVFREEPSQHSVNRCRGPALHGEQGVVLVVAVKTCQCRTLYWEP